MFCLYCVSVARKELSWGYIVLCCKWHGLSLQLCCWHPNSSLGLFITLCSVSAIQIYIFKKITLTLLGIKSSASGLFSPPPVATVYELWPHRKFPCHLIKRLKHCASITLITFYLRSIAHPSSPCLSSWSCIISISLSKFTPSKVLLVEELWEISLYRSDILLLLPVVLIWHVGNLVYFLISVDVRVSWSRRGQWKYLISKETCYCLVIVKCGGACWE